MHFLCINFHRKKKKKKKKKKMVSWMMAVMDIDLLGIEPAFMLTVMTISDDHFFLFMQ